MYEELIAKLRAGEKVFPGWTLYGYFVEPYSLTAEDLRQAANAIEKYSTSKPITNADLIRTMSDEELAEKFWMFTCVHAFDNKVKCKDDGCRKCWLRWLKEECE